jgi:hypothetical protein
MQNSFIMSQDLTFREFLSSTLYYYFTGRLLKKILLLLIGLTLLSMFLGSATTSKGINLATVFRSVAPIVILLLLIVIFAFLICLYIYKSKPYLFDNVSYDFTHWGVVRYGDRTEFSKPWRDITKFKETKAFFLLYIGNTDFHIIQKRMFTKSEELNAFRQLLRENIKN